MVREGRGTCDLNTMYQLTRRKFLLGALGAACALALPGCSGRSENTVVIYSCAEGVRNESLLAAMHEQFPSYDIRLHYISTGNCAARLKMEGAQSEADIILGLEGGYLKQVSEQLEELSAADSSRYCADLADADNRFFPFSRESACIAIDEAAFEERGLTVPQCYEDLTDPAFRGLVTMPNPKLSGTGYNFVKSLVNAWGEDEAFAYFDRLAENVYQFTSSGSGTVNALVQGEAAIGLGMTFQAVSEINQGVSLRVLFFEEGAPWAVYGLGIVQGKGERAAARDVFNWLATEGVKIDNATYVPDQVLVDFKADIPNYPSDIKYADMTGITDPDEKKRLLERWKY